ncbi:MAG TPA: hypothetical protein DCG25_10285, partial [Acidimicrobiaceae bacterium]|nr:hypothetical protein [Acidimicrobiaceae bacterium]
MNKEAILFGRVIFAGLQMELQNGSVVDRYTVQSVLGQGGMATVFRVKHSILGTQHALKVLKPLRSTVFEDIIREGRLQARLDPEFIVPVNDVITIDGTPALLMPLVDGCSLREVLNSYRPTPSETAAILASIARGVAIAHAEGIIHRDLKPPNILLDVHKGAVRIRVADFGLGVSVDTHEDHRGFAGTPAYSSPEQLSGRASPHPAQDLWAIGVIAVECLTGQTPFRGESLEDFREAHEKHLPNLG